MRFAGSYRVESRGDDLATLRDHVTSTRLPKLCDPVFDCADMRNWPMNTLVHCHQPTRYHRQ